MVGGQTPASRLRIARKSLGLSLSEMAAALGLRGNQAKDDLRKMEDGAREITGPVLVAAEALVEISRLTGKPVSDF
jgi:transcriptional regulator with XRE-family HTH domain